MLRINEITSKPSSPTDSRAIGGYFLCKGPFRLLMALALVMTPSCRDVMACDLCTSSITVRGQIRDAVGAPLEHASVAFDPRLNDCTGAALSVFDAVTGNSVVPSITDSIGQYAAHLRGSFNAQRYCTRI